MLFCALTIGSFVPILTDRSTKISKMPPGLLDTSVVVDWRDPAVVTALPDEMAISAVTAG
ncbi:hypothetical protein ABFA25_12080 [Mycobacterium lepromatosis]